LKELLLMMITKDIKFTELEEHLFKLVQDDESLASQSNTPILKSKNSVNLQNKHSRMRKEELKHSKIFDQQSIRLEPHSCDC
jgi:hypothetical protein